MNEQYWSWILGAVGVVGFILSGRKIWWSWYINLACQGLWFAYAIITTQYGFMATAVVYTLVFGKNAWSWTRERFGRETNKDLIKDKSGDQLYIHESHVLMAGMQSATECLNCRGNSKTTESLAKLVFPCTMELSVYDGNRKFLNNTGESNV